MGHKSKKHLKLDDQWCNYLIDVILGSHMGMLHLREPDGVLKLHKIMMDMLNDLYKLEKYRGNPQQFVADAAGQLNIMYQAFIKTKLVMYLENGMPVPKIIIQPNQAGRRMN